MHCDRCKTLKALFKCVLFFCSFAPESVLEKWVTSSTVYFECLSVLQIDAYTGVWMQTGFLNLSGLFAERRVSWEANHVELEP